MDRIPANKFA